MASFDGSPQVKNTPERIGSGVWRGKTLLVREKEGGLIQWKGKYLKVRGKEGCVIWWIAAGENTTRRRLTSWRHGFVRIRDTTGGKKVPNNARKKRRIAKKGFWFYRISILLLFTTVRPTCLRESCRRVVFSPAAIPHCNAQTFFCPGNILAFFPSSQPIIF